VNIGYTLSSEEHGPRELVANADAAEEAGFDFLMISDHYHPWTERQGHSPFVWSVLGALARATERVPIGTGVTCPIGRIHPAVLAQAAATTAILLEGRFLLGVGTGENLNEHITGARWPAGDERLDRLEEAVAVMRELWEGEVVTRRGTHFTVQQARVYDVPDRPPPVLVAAKGDRATELAGRIGDGLISVASDADTVKAFDRAGGAGKPRYGQVHVCWAGDEGAARRTAHEWWPNAGIGGELGSELPLPRHYEQAAETVREEDVAETVVCGPDPERHIEAIREYADAGFDHVWVHQIGPDQRGFLAFYESEVLPKVR
jgi:G6PDH family F420-dependent oxidoreductase